MTKATREASPRPRLASQYEELSSPLAPDNAFIDQLDQTPVVVGEDRLSAQSVGNRDFGKLHTWVHSPSTTLKALVNPDTISDSQQARSPSIIAAYTQT